MSRAVQRLVVWGGALVVCVTAAQLGVHPVGAVLLGIAGALLIAGALGIAAGGL